jgi:hypothetical protein
MQRNIHVEKVILASIFDEQAVAGCLIKTEGKLACSITNNKRTLYDILQQTTLRKNRRESDQCAVHTVEVSMQITRTFAQAVVET